MLYSDNTSRLKDDIRSILYNLERYLRLEAVDKLTVVCTCLIVGAIIFALATSAIFFLCNGLVKSITLLTGSEMISYYIVGGSLILLMVILCACRKWIIETQLVKVFSKSILEVPSLTNQYAARKDKADEIHKLAETLSRELDEYEEGGRK
ncbi:MAG: hypothetical protein MJZ41_02140 [Bacteroidaceae bacterium]|nr:hypothetical protein [Bacteroidaceae bacterium]